MKMSSLLVSCHVRKPARCKTCLPGLTDTLQLVLGSVKGSKFESQSQSQMFQNADFQILRFCPNVHNPLSISNVVFARQNHLQSAYHPISPNVPAVKVPLEGEREPNLEGERESRAENGISLGLHLPCSTPPPCPTTSSSLRQVRAISQLTQMAEHTWAKLTRAPAWKRT